MGQLKDLGLIKKAPKTDKAFDEITKSDFIKIWKDKKKGNEIPNQYFKYLWDKIEKDNSTRDIRGNLFEGIIATTLLASGIKPFFYNCNMAFVHAIKFDFILMRELLEEEPGHKDTLIPIHLSVKSSLRERWKQADLESRALREVHNRARCFLITKVNKDKKETESINNYNSKIEIGGKSGLHGIYDAYTEKFNELINELSKYQFSGDKGKTPIIVNSNKAIGN